MKQKLVNFLLFQAGWLALWGTVWTKPPDGSPDNPSSKWDMYPSSVTFFMKA